MRGSYDFETSRWTRPIFVGLLWGEPSSRDWACHYSLTDKSSVVRFALDTMRLLSKFEDVNEWWAHNGGNFDALIILEEADRLGWKVDASPAQGGRIVRMELRPGKHEKFTLLDSFAVVPSSLKNACRDFDLKSQKLFNADDYKGDMADLPRKKLEAGCRADCEAVAELLEVVDTHLTEWGGKLKSTFSSSALTCARHAAVESVGEWPITPNGVNEFCRAGYFGGRVEVFHHTPSGELCEYDVTSSYPWSMSQPLPWTFVEYLQEPSSLDWEGICEAEVSQPEGFLPVLPVKDKQGGLYFPTGTWRGTYPTVELRYARECGVHVKPLYGLRFDVKKPFAQFITDAFHLKETAKGATRQFAKLVLNGSYGKAAEKPEKEKLYVFADEESAAQNLVEATEKGQKVTVLSKRTLRFQLQEVFHWPKHTNFAMASYITARSRILLHQHLLRAGKGLAYCDTDSIHAPKTRALDAQVNSKLGGLKVEVKRLTAEYFAPKLYRLKNLDTGETMLASKGFPVDSKSFEKMIRGEKVFRDSMVKVKGQLRRHDNRFTRLEGESATFRSWGGRSAKRCPLLGGGTRPWTIEEIRDGKHIEARSPLAKFSARGKKSRP